jgi:hypothetical protein
MDNPVCTSVCHGSLGSHARRSPGWSNRLQEPHCDAVVCATYYCGGRGHRHCSVTDVCQLVRTAVEQ